MLHTIKPSAFLGGNRNTTFSPEFGKRSPGTCDTSSEHRKTSRTMSSSDLKKYYKNKRVLLTGAGGFIGSFLARRLIACGAGGVAAVQAKEHANRRRDT